MTPRTPPIALPTALPHLAVISVEGPDAGSFLQGQLTQDVLSQTSSQARPGGYCSAKGRLLANFVILHPGPQAWWLVIHASLADAVVKRLRMFVLRARCTVQRRSEWEVSGIEPCGTPLWQVLEAREGSGGLQMGWWSGRGLLVQARSTDGAPDRASETPAPSNPPLPGEGPEPAPEETPAELEAWMATDIRAGWPWIESTTQDQFVPQMVNLELLGGVNFRKGCYPGQEVVARSQYRGTLKRRMLGYRVSVQSGSPAPQAGQEVFHSDDPGQPAGMIVNAAKASVCGPGSPVIWALLVEIKTAATRHGSLHWGSIDGLTLEPITLPYPVPAEAQD